MFMTQKGLIGVIMTKHKAYHKQCWKCGSTDTFITSPLPYDEENIIYVACCNMCLSWSFVREPRTLTRIKKMLADKKLNRVKRQDRQPVSYENAAPEYTMDFTQSLDEQ